MTLSRARSVLATATTLALAATLTACESGAGSPGSDRGSSSAAGSGGGAGTATAERPRTTVNVRTGAQDVPVDRVVEVRAGSGTLRDVSVRSEGGTLPGRLDEDRTTWTASDRLEPGTSYVLRVRAEGSDGTTAGRTTRFRTQDLTLDQQTYPSVAPLDGETVGVGMPVVVAFDVPVTDRAAIEEHLTVSSTPRQPGAWHWLSDTEVHWRPQRYWKAGTEVAVDVDINSVHAGGGIYGQESRRVEFEVGEAHVYRVDARTHQMKVFSDGELLRTIPITLGKPGFTTRSGTKVIVEKFETRRMNSETVGIPAGSAEAYDIDDVRYAMRLTYSGEFIHAAPWSVGSQGHANVSHGCTGMSTEDAGWLYALTRRGDVVEYTGTGRPMTLENGYGDWNASFEDYRQGSALSAR